MPLALPPMIRDETHETLVIGKEVLAAEDLAQHYVVIGKARCGGEFGLARPEAQTAPIGFRVSTWMRG
jgi:hypothetical protein